MDTNEQQQHCQEDEEDKMINRLRNVILIQEKLKKAAEAKHKQNNLLLSYKPIRCKSLNYTTDTIGKHVLVRKNYGMKRIQSTIKAKVLGEVVTNPIRPVPSNLQGSTKPCVSKSKYRTSNENTYWADLSNIKPVPGVTVSYKNPDKPAMPLIEQKWGKVASQLFVKALPDTNENTSILPSRQKKLQKESGRKIRLPTVYSGLNAIARHFEHLETSREIFNKKGGLGGSANPKRGTKVDRSISVSKSQRTIRRMPPPPLGMTVGHGLFDT